MPELLAHDDDATSQAMALLSFFGRWQMARHEWIVHGMRSLVAGEGQPALQHLPDFAAQPLAGLKLPEGLHLEFADESQRLEQLWQEVVQSLHPLSELPLHQQLDRYQRHAERFMREAERSSQRLWRDFALRDPLTGARTRLTLRPALRERQLACGRNVPSCLAVFSHDNLDAINARWGDAISDNVLSVAARLMQQQLRPGDQLFRMHRDGWLVLLPDTRIDQARDIAARLCAQVLRHPFAAPGQRAFHATLVFGVAEAHGFETPEAWVARAERALDAVRCSPPALNSEADAA